VARRFNIVVISLLTVAGVMLAVAAKDTVALVIGVCVVVGGIGSLIAILMESRKTK
jgi:hypothetical protein